MAAGEWQQDLTRRARLTGRGRTGAEGTAGDNSGFSAPVSPSLQTLKLHGPPPPPTFFYVKGPVDSAVEGV